MDRKGFRNLLEDKGAAWTKDMLDAELWDQERRQEAHIYLQEQQEAAAKAHGSFHEGGTFWVAMGLVAAGVALAALAWVALGGPPVVSDRKI